jgi:hypothetical protein
MMLGRLPVNVMEITNIRGWVSSPHARIVGTAALYWGTHMIRPEGLMPRSLLVGVALMGLLACGGDADRRSTTRTQTRAATQAPQRRSATRPSTTRPKRSTTPPRRQTGAPADTTARSPLMNN